MVVGKSFGLVANVARAPVEGLADSSKHVIHSHTLPRAVATAVTSVKCFFFFLRAFICNIVTILQDKCYIVSEMISALYRRAVARAASPGSPRG